MRTLDRDCPRRPGGQELLSVAVGPARGKDKGRRLRRPKVHRMVVCGILLRRTRPRRPAPARVVLQRGHSAHSPRLPASSDEP